MIEIIADDHMRLANKPIENLGLPDGAIIAAIHRGTDVIIPNEDTEILKNDRVIIICLLSEVADLEKFLRSGRTGFFK